MVPLLVSPSSLMRENLKEKGFFILCTKKVKIVLRFHFFVSETISRAKKEKFLHFSTQEKRRKSADKKGIYFRCRGRSRRKHFPKKRRLTSSRMTFSGRDYGNSSLSVFAMEASHFGCCFFSGGKK
jgi:hypothetical protein